MNCLLKCDWLHAEQTFYWHTHTLRTSCINSDSKRSIPTRYEPQYRRFQTKYSCVTSTTIVLMLSKFVYQVWYTSNMHEGVAAKKSGECAKFGIDPDK